MSGSASRRRASEISSRRIDQAVAPPRSVVGSPWDESDALTADPGVITPETARQAALTVCCAAVAAGAGKEAAKTVLDVLGLLPGQPARPP